MGWLMLLVLGAGAMGLLVALGVPRLLWSFVGAALMLGAAGYAWQGSPSLPGHAPDLRGQTPPDDPQLLDLRDDMLGRYTLDNAYVTAADAMTASGDDRAAVLVLLGGINKLPQSYMLWTVLGTAYARHDQGQISPAARFAFQRARQLAPGLPGPPFFEGLVFARAGDLEQARTLWLRALKLAPANATYRRDIAIRLAVLDQLAKMQRTAPAVR